MKPKWLTLKKKAPFYGVGGTRTHARPPIPIFWGSKALPTELRLDRTQQKQLFFFNSFYLTTLMIRTTTDLVPSRFLAYKPLFEALTGFMVIAYIIMIGKLI